MEAEEAEALAKAVEADQDIERIPVPGSSSVPLNKQPRKPGIFASIFQRKKT